MLGSRKLNVPRDRVLRVKAENGRPEYRKFCRIKRPDRPFTNRPRDQTRDSGDDLCEWSY